MSIDHLPFYASIGIKKTWMRWIFRSFSTQITSTRMTGLMRWKPRQSPDMRSELQASSLHWVIKALESSSTLFLSLLSVGRDRVVKPCFPSHGCRDGGCATVLLSGAKVLCPLSCSSCCCWGAFGVCSIKCSWPPCICKRNGQVKKYISQSYAVIKAELQIWFLFAISKTKGRITR